MSDAGLQQNLAASGYDPGPVDGVRGPRTMAALLSFLAHRELGSRGLELAFGIVAEFPKAAINTRLRIIHALAQASHESGGFRYMEELGGPTYFKRYDGRKDLGNTLPGDGARFHGRGIIQITGRANYAKYGAKLGLDLIGNPELAAQPANAVRIFCAYWTDHGLNVRADADDITGITRRINGGLNGFEDRKVLVARLKKVWPE